jgi:hypothetical protein
MFTLVLEDAAPVRRRVPETFPRERLRSQVLAVQLPIIRITRDFDAPPAQLSA